MSRAMSRISIDVTPQQHKRLKALAALQGQSIKDFVLAATLGKGDDNAALAELEELLGARLQSARDGDLSSRSVEDVFKQARGEGEHGPDV